LIGKRKSYFAKDFQIQRFFLQAFPKIPLAVLSVFSSLQVRQAQFHFLQMFWPVRAARRLGFTRALA